MVTFFESQYKHIDEYQSGNVFRFDDCNSISEKLCSLNLLEHKKIQLGTSYNLTKYKTKINRNEKCIKIKSLLLETKFFIILHFESILKAF